MDRLVEALAVLAPPSLHDAAAAAGCPPAAIRELERNGRIVVLDEDLAYAMPTYRDLAAKALALAGREPLTPAAFRDATGTSRRYVLGDPRGPRSTRHPAAHACRPRAGSAGTGGRSRRNVTAAPLPAVERDRPRGGRSTRFGRDKLAEPVDGRPLLHHAVEAVAAVATDVIVVAPPDVDLAVPEGVRLVHDEAPFEGPLAGCMTGLIAAREPLVVVAGGDMPSLEPAVLALLDSRARRVVGRRGAPRASRAPSAAAVRGAHRGRDRCGAAPARPGGTTARGTHRSPDRAGACGGGVAPARPRCAHAARRRRAGGPAGRLANAPDTRRPPPEEERRSACMGARSGAGKGSAPVWIVEEGGQRGRLDGAERGSEAEAAESRGHLLADTRLRGEASERACRPRSSRSSWAIRKCAKWLTSVLLSAPPLLCGAPGASRGARSRHTDMRCRIRMDNRPSAVSASAMPASPGARRGPRRPPRTCR